MSAFVPPLAAPPARRGPSARVSPRARPAMTVATPAPRTPAPAPAPQPAAPSSKPGSFAEAPIRELTSVEDYLALLEQSATRLVVLKVYAPWCRSCRGLVPKVARLAREFPDVVFAKLDFEAHTELCYRLGVTSMPTFIMYHGPAGEIHKFSCGPLRAHVLRQKIVDSVQGVCELGPDGAAEPPVVAGNAPPAGR